MNMEKIGTRKLLSAFEKDAPKDAIPALRLQILAWDELPSGSLPNDDDFLAREAHVRPCNWQKRKASIMRGWVLCTDNRWYHPLAFVGVHLAMNAKEKGRKRHESNARAVAMSVFDAIGPGREYLSEAAANYAREPSDKGANWEPTSSDIGAKGEREVSEIEIGQQNQRPFSVTTIPDKRPTKIDKTGSDQVANRTGPYSQTDEQFMDRVASGEASF